MKVKKRIVGNENYYVTMSDGDEIHITNEKSEILLSLTMTKKGLRKWHDHTLPNELEEVEA